MINTYLFLPFVEPFSNRFNITSSFETFDEVEVCFFLESVQFPEEDKIIPLIKTVSTRDSLEFILKIGDTEASHQLSHSYQDFISSFKLRILNREEHELISLKIKVFKNVKNNSVSIYSFDLFAIFLNSLSLEELLNYFSRKIEENGHLLFISNETKSTLKSAAFAFVSEAESTEVVFNYDYKTRIELIRSVTNTSILSKIQIVPEHFNFSQKEFFPKELKNKFEMLSLLLVIISIFDTTSLDGNSLSYQLSGYKSIKSKVDFTKISLNPNLEEYSLIYNWIYEGGSLIDKIGLARNIISLHFENQEELDLKGKVFQSVLSSYKVYEKQNIKQYIEIRNKMSDQLLEYNKKASQIIDSFASGFQKNSLGVATLFSTIIATRILNTTNQSDSFIFYATLISFAFLLISLGYMFIARWEVKQQMKRIQLSYQNFKERYTDLLTKEDIDRILNYDKEFNDDMKFIKAKLKSYTILWAFVLGILLLVVVCYYFFGILNTIMNLFFLIFSSIF